MDGTQISSNDVDGFRANLNLSPQLTESVYLGKVQTDMSGPDGKLFNADDVGQSDPKDIDTIIPDSPEGLLDQTRRVGAYKGFHDGKYAKDLGAVKNQLVDPSGEVVAAMRAGKMRKHDSIIRVGFFGSAREGESGETTVAYKAAQVIAVDNREFLHQDEAAAASGNLPLTIGKLLKARSMFNKSHIKGKRYIACDSDDISYMLSRMPTTHSMYSNVKRLETGEINSLLGFEFVTDEDLPDGTDSSMRALPAWIDTAVQFKAREVVLATIAPRSDKSFRPYAYYESQHGFCRRYDKGVLKILCDKPG